MVTILLVLVVPGAHAQDIGPDLQITSKNYIVIDADTGEVFAERNAHKHAPMASLTKIFTAIEAIELASPQAEMTTDGSDVFDDSSTRMGFGTDERFTFQDLLYGMLLPSGNDAAHAIARNLGKQPGDTDEQAVARFVDATNARIRDLGLTETHLVNPHGWGVPNHYSSAHDLAAFMMYALKYPRFVDTISTGEYATSDGNYSFRNTNRMLDLYDGILGGKTGYDDDAGYCLIEVARRDGSTMISVTLNGVAPDDWYDDNRVLLDYAFQQKAARVAAKRPISPGIELVKYRDPDAAIITRGAKSGASIGAPLQAQPLSAVKPSSKATDRRGAQAGRRHDSGGRLPGRQVLAAMAVASLIIAARSVRVFHQSRRKRSSAFESPSAPSSPHSPAQGTS